MKNAIFKPALLSDQPGDNNSKLRQGPDGLEAFIRLDAATIATIKQRISSSQPENTEFFEKREQIAQYGCQPDRNKRKRILATRPIGKEILYRHEQRIAINRPADLAETLP